MIFWFFPSVIFLAKKKKRKKKKKKERKKRKEKKKTEPNGEDFCFDTLYSMYLLPIICPSFPRVDLAVWSMSADGVI